MCHIPRDTLSKYWMIVFDDLHLIHIQLYPTTKVGFISLILIQSIECNMVLIVVLMLCPKVDFNWMVGN